MIRKTMGGVLLAAGLSTWASETKAESIPKGLDARQRGVAGIAALTAIGDLPRLEVSLQEGLDSGLTVNEIKEVLIQMYAYAGFPRSLNGIGIFMKVLEARKAQGKVDSTGTEPSPIPAGTTSLDLGTRIQTELLGGAAAGGLYAFAPGIDTFLKSHLFGDVFGRGVLDWRTREIATVAALASMREVSPQLQGHFRVARNVGVTQVQLEGVLDVVEMRVDPALARNARALLASIPGAASEDDAIRVVPLAAPTAAREHFTGKVEVAQPFQAGGPSRYFGAKVAFSPAARTDWHQHPLGQTLIVTSGKGFVQGWGEPAQPIHTGDVVWIPPYRKHWHGAAPDQSLTHIAITEPLSGCASDWMEPVDNAQYGAVTKSGAGNSRGSMQGEAISSPSAARP